ncbi:MAG: hypothetical protein FWD26_05755 [Treponema sp.]|nr:hypothetical protein [Treponema sp.]
MKALIITDRTETIQSIAHFIKDTLTDYKFSIIPAEDFKGDELLPAEIFFLGCEDPSPTSFAFLEQLFSHINLASRKCGVFSPKENTNNYLLSILKDSEAFAVPVLSDSLYDSKGKLKESAVNEWFKQITK